jgi:serine/threonine protein kinase
VRTIGRYEVRRELSRGTTPLFEAVDVTLDRPVIIRALAHALAIDAERRSRFLDAAMLAARLSHPRIARILDLGEHCGDPFVVLELPDGVSLRSLLDSSTPPSFDEGVDILAQLCAATVHAHGHGVTQFGLRPAGIFVSESSHVTVVPFGTIPIFGSGATLAALSRDEIAYLAPELVESRMPDRRADVFTLGVIGFELLAGRRPFQATNIPALLHALVHEEPDLQALPPNRHTPAIERVIANALARDPSARYSDAGLMLVDLEALTLETPSSSVTAAANLLSPQTDGMPDLARAQALTLAADGLFADAQALLAGIEATEPGDPRNALLRDYLRDEQAVHVQLVAIEHFMAQGRLREARAAAGAVLSRDPSRRRALEFVRQLDRMLFAFRDQVPPAFAPHAPAA